MAEAIFSRMVADAGLEDQITVDSAGTGSWHVGEMAHRGTRRVLQEHGIDYKGRARQVTQQDLLADTYIVAMDQSNVSELRRRFGNELPIYRLLDFARDTDVRDVPDPYYSGNFEYVYQLVEDGCRGLLEMIRQEEDI
jgi:protein-tyrosine phosphatase